MPLQKYVIAKQITAGNFSNHHWLLSCSKNIHALYFIWANYTVEAVMSISTRLETYLSNNNITYQAIPHCHSKSSIGSAFAAEIPVKSSKSCHTKRS